jgi:hypothetical protein
MTHVEISVTAAAWDDAAVVAAIEGVMHAQGLLQSLKSSLRSYDGCVHWHYKRRAAAGTIEVTAWPAERRVWLSVQSGRAAGWIDGMLPQIRAALESSLNPVHRPTPER